MSRYSSRPCAGVQDLSLLIEFARSTTRDRWPRPTYKKVGDMVWGFDPNSDLAANLRLWFDRAGLAGYAWFGPPINFEFDIRAGLDPEEPLTHEILDWAEQRAHSLALAGRGPVPKSMTMLSDASLATEVLDSDGRRRALLERRGYARSERYEARYSRSLAAPVAAPDLPAGYRLRHATDADIEQRVDLHRDAWSVWGPSRMTVERYLDLRAAPLYDQELDVVLEGPDGRLVSYCIAWLDAPNRFGHFEPVGCRPAFVGRGFARAVTFEGLRRMRQRGAHTALVATASVNQRARVLYPSCGFVEVDRAYSYVKNG
ncbi:MAG TPA: GNAT family N-acetyltransferase [Candidatus Binataceae bacterium]|nr:GNAT family N-acetyltransferase [Candidatus Binataceae bacterium]